MPCSTVQCSTVHCCNIPHSERREGKQSDVTHRDVKYRAVLYSIVQYTTVVHRRVGFRDEGGTIRFPPRVPAQRNIHAFPLVTLVMCRPCALSAKNALQKEGSQSPRSKGAGLVSTLHRNSAYRCRYAALASSRDTSGGTDKDPVLHQSCRCRSVLIVILRAPTKSAWS